MYSLVGFNRNVYKAHDQSNQQMCCTRGLYGVSHCLWYILAKESITEDVKQEVSVHNMLGRHAPKVRQLLGN